MVRAQKDLRRLLIGTLLLSPSLASAGAVAECDFDGDGYGDVAVGAPADSVSSNPGAGVVHVLYGSKSGLSSTGSQLLNEGSLSGGWVESGDGFGAALACADFDQDGFDDLALGIPGEDFSSDTNTGKVLIAWGSASGITTSSPEYLDYSNTSSSPAINDFFGWALTTGDYDGDGFPDLAIGVPGRAISTGKRAGEVVVTFGGVSRNMATGAQVLNLKDAGGTTNANDRFGWSLTSGDFDADGYDDIASGAPFWDAWLGFNGDEGAVGILLGGPSSISPGGVLTEFDLSGSPTEDDRFGMALAAGDWDKDGAADLAVGVPAATVSGQAMAGKVAVFSGGSASAGSVLHQDVSGVSGVSGAQDRFGQSLTSSDFDGDGIQDLAVGIPGETINGNPAGGLVTVFAGSAGSVSTPRLNQVDPCRPSCDLQSGGARCQSPTTKSSASAW